MQVMTNRHLATFWLESKLFHLHLLDSHLRILYAVIVCSKIYSRASFCVVSATATCSQCGKGATCGSPDCSSCTHCVEGKYQPDICVTNATSCKICNAGSITDTGTETGATTCTACTGGKFSTASNVPSCTDCNAGSITNTGTGTGATSKTFMVTQTHTSAGSWNEGAPKPVSRAQTLNSYKLNPSAADK